MQMIAVCASVAIVAVAAHEAAGNIRRLTADIQEPDLTLAMHYITTHKKSGDICALRFRSILPDSGSEPVLRFMSITNRIRIRMMKSWNGIAAYNESKVYWAANQTIEDPELPGTRRREWNYKLTDSEGRTDSKR